MHVPSGSSGSRTFWFLLVVLTGLFFLVLFFLGLFRGPTEESAVTGVKKGGLPSRSPCDRQEKSVL
jgi:hypothetical protein